MQIVWSLIWDHTIWYGGFQNTTADEKADGMHLKCFNQVTRTL